MLFDWSNRMIGARRPRVRRRRRRRRQPASRASCTCTSTTSPSSARPTRATTSSPSSSTPRSTATSSPSSSSTCSCCCSPSPATRPPATPPRGACARCMQQPRAVRRAREATSTASSTARSRRSSAGPRRCTTSAAPRSSDTELARPGDQGGRQGRHLAHLGQPRRGRCSTTRSRFDIERSPERAHRLRRRRPALLPRRQPGPHGAAAHLPARSSTRIPDMQLIAEPSRSSARTSSAASSTCRSPSPRASESADPRPSVTANLGGCCSAALQQPPNFSGGGASRGGESRARPPARLSTF